MENIRTRCLMTEQAREQLLSRFLSYVAVCTTSSSDAAQKGIMPSTTQQLDLANILLTELQSMGITNACITEYGYVRSKYGTLGLLRSTDRPEIEPILVHSEILPGTAFGSKGIGELCTIPTAPAIANAYRRIDGIFRKSLPLSDTPYSRKKQ